MNSTDLPQRMRINATLRMGTQQQAIMKKEPINIHQKKLALEVSVPPSLQKPNHDPLLRPLQTNTRQLEAQGKPLMEPAKKLARAIRKEYKLVQDKDIPIQLKDARHNIAYKKLNCLGSGAFAKVYRFKSRDKYHAAKIVSKESLRPENIKKKLFAEINIHRVLKHEYIVNFESCFEDKLNIYLVLELCSNGTLSGMLRNRKILTEDEVRYYMGQILSALRYMSDNRILHRDLKLGNVLLDENMDCKLGDFGLAALLIDGADRRRTICGTPHYIAPEILFNKQGHDHRADMWSAGVLMFNLLYGKHPFHHDEPNKLYDQVRQNELSREYTFPKNHVGFKPVSEYAKDLISKLLVNNPDTRLSVIEALEHGFFSKFKSPLRIPKTALYKIPEDYEMFGDDEPSKVDDAIRRAKDRNESHVDHNVNPPLKIMHEVILDPRTQYPVRLSSQSSTIPTLETSSKKRSNTTVELSVKRPCLPKTKPLSPESDGVLPKVEKLSVNADEPAKTFAIPLPLPGRKPIMEEMAGNLKVMIDRRSAIPASRRTLTAAEDDDFTWHGNNVFVQNWIDCTPCYGFAYRFSDGTMGVLYNDGSTMTSVNEKEFYYIYHRYEDNRYVEATYNDGVPQELKKKRELLNTFKKYTVGFLPLEFSVPQSPDATKVHLFKYMISDTCITFRLNNGVIQFNFFKGGKLVLYETGKRMIYIDTNRKMRHFNTIDVFKSEEKNMVDALNSAYEVLQGQNQERMNALRNMRWQRMAKEYSAEASITTPIK
ncbi:kinase-like domain-containing protein [Mucor mucedo]|uniref:kinase-like domain-containing protein n=1 Tax=Mucor mucedo TaxID=29922 RepID=UPI0022211C86|nr:kinase-like domain-containing protein [Mucor mucedo]KAI7879550.1 kinase-like domain-containing protein [Mucor mucedo]